MRGIGARSAGGRGAARRSAPTLHMSGSTGKVGRALRARHRRPEGAGAALRAAMRGSEIRAHLHMSGSTGKVGRALRARHRRPEGAGGALRAAMRGSEIRAHLDAGDISS